jgi:hypothetical protein
LTFANGNSSIGFFEPRIVPASGRPIDPRDAADVND